MNAPPRGAGDVGTELSIYVRSPNEARTALAFGIDRIILDTHRTRVGTSSKFDLHSLEWAFNLARRLGKKATVWFDREPREREEGDIVEVANSLERIGFSSAIVKDPMSVSILKEKSIRETVLDPTRPVSNPRAFEFWRKSGFAACFPAHELSAAEIARLISSSPSSSLIFACIAPMESSGRLNYYGEMTQTGFVFTAIYHLLMLLKSGTLRLVIIPPEKGDLSVAILTRAFRRALRLAETGNLKGAEINRLVREVYRVIRRPLSRGFLPGYLHIPRAGRPPAGRLLDATLAGSVREFFSEQRRARVILNSDLKVGDEVMIITPEGDFRVKLRQMSLMDRLGNALESVSPASSKEASLHLPFDAPSGSIIVRT